MPYGTSNEFLLLSKQGVGVDMSAVHRELRLMVTV